MDTFKLQLIIVGLPSTFFNSSNKVFTWTEIDSANRDFPTPKSLKTLKLNLLFVCQTGPLANITPGNLKERLLFPITFGAKASYNKRHL